MGRVPAGQPGAERGLRVGSPGDTTAGTGPDLAESRPRGLQAGVDLTSGTDGPSDKLDETCEKPRRIAAHAPKIPGHEEPASGTVGP
ncbi:hypothetical protein M2158_002997 [Streptomyces sp. SAI-144]|nr:hypothetical protein [Streptomyces sp. SAI-144]